MSLFLTKLYQYVIQRTYLCIWLSTGGLGLATVYIRIKVIFLGNPDVGGIESNVIYGILRMLAGYPLYQNPEQAPFAITQYSPIYYYLTVGLSRTLGLTAQDVYEVYAVGRCISLVANGLYIWGIIQLARCLQLPTSVAALVGILAFVLIPPQSYGRPDSLYNAVVVWTIWSMLRWNVSGRAKLFNYGAALTAFLAAIALFTKQSALCLPIIIGGYLVFFKGKPQHLFPFLGWFSLFLSLLYASAFREETTLLYANMVQGVSNGIDFANFRYNLIDHYLRPFVWLVIPGLAISIRYIIFERSVRQTIGVANLGLFLFALATGLKWGAALNYFTEFTGLSCLLMADVLWQLRNTYSDWANVGRLGLLLGIMCIVPINAMNFNWTRTFGKSTDLTQYKQEQVVARYIINELKQCPDCLVYSTLYNSSYLNAFLFRNCIVPQQDLIVGSAYPFGTFNYTNLNRAAQDGRIQLVVSRDEEAEAPLSPPIQLANYHPIKSLYGYTIHRFNLPSATNPVHAKPSK